MAPAPFRWILRVASALMAIAILGDAYVLPHLGLGVDPPPRDINGGGYVIFGFMAAVHAIWGISLVKETAADSQPSPDTDSKSKEKGGAN